MTEGVVSEAGFVGGAGAAQSRVGRRPVQPGDRQQNLGMGGAEQGWSTDAARPGTGTAAGVPRLAGRIKRRRERAGRGRRPQVCYEAVLKLDAELCAASKGVARLRLELGEALEALVQSSGVRELGYSSLHDYAVQRCSQTGRWAEDTRRVATRLGSLPALRAGLVSGEVNWSMAELVSRHATAKTDGELAEQAKGLTVRQMRERLGQSARGERSDEDAAGGQRDDAAKGGRGHEAADGNQQTDDSVGPAAVESGDSEFMTVELGDWPPFPDVDEVDPIRTLTITVDRDVAWLFESTRMLVELLVGQSNTDTLLECLLAEALTSLPGERARGCALYEDYAQEQARQRAQLEQQARWVQECEAACEKNFAALLGLGGAQGASNGKREPETSCAAPGGQEPGQQAATSEADPGRSFVAPPGQDGAQAGVTAEDDPEQNPPAPLPAEPGQLEANREREPRRSFTAPLGTGEAQAVVAAGNDREGTASAPLGTGGAQAAVTAEKEPEQNPSTRPGCAAKQKAPTSKGNADAQLCDPRRLGSISELDSWIGELAAKLARWDLHVGMLADKLHQVEGWRRLGFSTETQYGRERLGMCASSLRAKRALARRLRTLPRVREALEQGAIGLDAAVQIGKVATERTEKLWLERAKRRTAKHLREEVELGELVMRRTGQRGCLPPTEEQMRQYFEVERAITSGRALVDALLAQQEPGSGEAQTEQDTGGLVEGDGGSAQGGVLDEQQRAAGMDRAVDTQSDSEAGSDADAAAAAECQMSGWREAQSGQHEGGSVEGDGGSARGGVLDEQQRAAGMDRAVDTQPDSEAGSDADAAAAAECQMSGSESAPSTGHSTPERPNCRRGWHSRLVGMAAVVRAYLGLGGDNSGPAGAFDELAAAMYDRPIAEVGRLKGIGGRVTLRLRVRQSTACYYRLVEREARRWLPPDVSFMEYACLAMWAGWCHTLDRQVAYAHIYARDRHRCSCPVCTQRNVTPHHVRFRSRGGDDSDENVTSPCSTCHLGLIHGGVITVQGPATRLSWSIGRDRGLRVVGREKVLG
jgi:hypothetical protein